MNITIPSGAEFSPAINSILEAGLVSFKNGAEHLVEIECDRHERQRAIDFRPNLP